MTRISAVPLLSRGIPLLVALAHAGCATEASGPDAAADDTSTGAPPGTTGEDDSADTTTGSDEDVGTSSSGGDDMLVPAVGIRLDEITVNQGVSVPVWAAESGFVDGSGRNAPLLPRRAFLVTARWSVDDDWQPRAITARLRLDGETFDVTQQIDASADPDDVASHLAWLLEASVAEPDRTFQIELLEPADGAAGEPDAFASAPPEGPRPVGFESASAVLDVLLVPTRIETATCQRLAEPDAEEAERIRVHLLQMFPVQEVSIEIAKDELYTTYPIGINADFGSFFDLMVDFRTSHGIPSHAFVIAMFDNCGLPNTSGRVAQLGSPSETNLYQRVAALPTVDRFPDYFADSIPHIAGFMVGRTHVLCTGGEAGADPNYPYEDGDIGRWGYGIVDGVVRPPTHKDYMSFCEPQWVSDYGWRLAYAGLQEIESWKRR